MWRTKRAAVLHLTLVWMLPSTLEQCLLVQSHGSESIADLALVHQSGQRVHNEGNFCNMCMCFPLSAEGFPLGTANPLIGYSPRLIDHKDISMPELSSHT